MHTSNKSSNTPSLSSSTHDRVYDSFSSFSGTNSHHSQERLKNQSQNYDLVRQNESLAGKRESQRDSYFISSRSGCSLLLRRADEEPLFLPFSSNHSSPPPAKRSKNDLNSSIKQRDSSPNVSDSGSPLEDLELAALPINASDSTMYSSASVHQIQDVSLPTRSFDVSVTRETPLVRTSLFPSLFGSDDDKYSSCGDDTSEEKFDMPSFSVPAPVTVETFRLQEVSESADKKSPKGKYEVPRLLAPYLLRSVPGNFTCTKPKYKKDVRSRVVPVRRPCEKIITDEYTQINFGGNGSMRISDTKGPLASPRDKLLTPSEYPKYLTLTRGSRLMIIDDRTEGKELGGTVCNMVRVSETDSKRFSANRCKAGDHFVKEKSSFNSSRKRKAKD